MYASFCWEYLPKQYVFLQTLCKYSYSNVVCGTLSKMCHFSSACSEKEIENYASHPFADKRLRKN